ncbi:hypothetical protein LCGC14_1042430 [marine sediment metagenome]|uniref:Uncharacterized protein n=1 Tax=marine sediment metagenome TaxID=412755 RepID=A0A0F9ND34_9ZZZZ
MTKKNGLIWKLKELPTVEEVTALVDGEIISKKEAKEILFRTGGVNSNELKDLKKEVELLRELVLTLSNKQQTVIYPIVRQYQDRYPWYRPYAIWCSSVSTGDVSNINADSSQWDTVTASLTSQNK